MTRYLLLNPQGGDGGGAAPSTPVVSESDPSEAFQRLLKKHNDDGTRLAEKLFGENYELRQKNSTLSARVPGEGAVVLQGDDAKKWAKYRELGDPNEVKTSLESGKAAVTKLEGIGRAETFRKAAVLGGYNPDVFAELAESKGVQVEFKEETRDGKAVEVALVKGEGDSRTPLTQFVESNFSKFLPALKQGQQPPPRDRSKDGTPPRRPASAPPRLDDRDDDGTGLERELASSGMYHT